MKGFKIDSSVFPIYHDRYGIPDARRDIHQIETKSGTIWEFPPSVMEYGKFNLPVSGLFGDIYQICLLQDSNELIIGRNKRSISFAVAIVRIQKLISK